MKSRRTAEPVTDRRDVRDRLLLASLSHVVFDGWTDAALRAGAADCGMDEIDVKRFFPGGAREMIEHFSDWADRRMLASLAGHDIEAMPVRARVGLSVRLRLEALAPWREAVRRTLSLLALPPNLPLGARCLYRTVDAIWRAIGDRSVDFNFYTKRGLLAAVLSATTLYWLDDDSDGGEATRGFLDRRIADVMKVPSLTRRLGSVAERLPDPFRALRRARRRFT
jgi:ubiquinone biosynthesis protein COQ9